MLLLKVFAKNALLLCTLLLLCAGVKSVYAVSSNQAKTTTGQTLMIEINDFLLRPALDSEVVTLTGQITLDPSPLHMVMTGLQSTVIDHVEVRVDNGALVTATLDALGNWAVGVKACTMPSYTEATVVAKDGTRVSAEFTLCGPTGDTDGSEPSQPVRLFTFLPIISKK